MVSAGRSSPLRRRRRPRDDDRGAATLELAFAIPVLVVVLVAALSGIACLTTQMRCTDAAHQAARLAARGDLDAASETARGLIDGAEVTVNADAEIVTVRVRTAPIRLFPGLTLSAEAVAPMESDR
jgi:Flp pilus assembly protein TadG